MGAKVTGKVVNAPPGRECTPRGKARVQSFEEIGEIWTVGEVIQVVSACVLRATTKKCQLFRRRKVHHRQNSGYAYAVNSVSRLKFARLWKACTQHRQMMRFSSAHALAQYCTSKQSETVKRQHELFCRLAIKETDFVLNCNNSFTVIFQSRRRHCKYD